MNNLFAINKIQIWKFLPLILILNYVPFVLRDDYIGVPISTFIFGFVFVISIYFDNKIRIPNNYILLIISSLTIIYFSWNLIFNSKYLLATVNDFILVCISIWVCQKFKEFNYFDAFYYLWLHFLVIIAIMTILSYALFFYNLIPFYNIELGGYDVMYNNLFLGRMHVGPFFRRASLYFNEPSYLGFFIGLNLFFLFSIKFQNKTLLIVGLIISGILSGSMTLLIVFISVLSMQIVFKNIFKVKDLSRSILYLTLFVAISISYNSFKDSFLEILDFGSRLDRDMRASRSIDLLFSSSIPHLLFGYGSTYIAKVDYLGESNSYLRLAVENGLIVLVLAIGLIYKTLKKNPELMLFMLISLHSIVLFLTPFVICFLMFINYYYYHHQKSKNLQIS